MKTIASMDRSEPILSQAPSRAAGVSGPRRRFSLLVTGSLLVLGVPVAILQTVAMAYVIQHI